ncbi:MAG: DHH family phosphoesterase [Thermaerobacter sp.]|nr:DHH family phosphoesterase [Thermaerobacter sp.]
MTDREQASQLLLAASRILIAMHAQPDGDTTGSALSLMHALSARGKEVAVVCRDPVPARYRFLPGAAAITDWTAVRAGSFDVAVAVDCGAETRIGAVEEYFGAAPITLNIDHHVSNNRYATVNWVEGQAAATGEMLAGLLQDWGASIAQDEAVCLYTAISTDTLSFQQVNTSVQTLATVAALAASGFDLARVNEALWESETASEAQLLGWALLHAQLSGDGRIAWLEVPRALLHQLRARDEDADGLVHHLRAIDSVMVAIVTRELPDGKTIKISWRGKSHVDVTGFARQFGGGGHRYSAAAQVAGTLAEVTRRAVIAVGVPDFA